jgi:phosphatidylglycerophosphate synthase
MSFVAERPKADCYSAGERRVMVWWQERRAEWLGPSLALAERAGVRPDHVTFSSLLCGLAFCPLWLWPAQSPWTKAAALGALLLHVVLDGLDGPLARHLKTASRRGSFTDTLADQIVVTATTLALMAASPAALGIWVGGLYIFFYSLVVAMAMVRNGLGQPYSWLIRPRFWVYVCIVADAYLLPGSLNLVVGFFTAALALKLLTGFLALRRLL